MKVFRLVSGLMFKVVGHDGPRNLNPGTLNTFPTSVAVQPATCSGSMTQTPPRFPTLASLRTRRFRYRNYTNLADGQQGTFLSPFNSNARDNISAVVAFKASNADTLARSSATSQTAQRPWP